MCYCNWWQPLCQGPLLQQWLCLQEQSLSWEQTAYVSSQQALESSCKEDQWCQPHEPEMYFHTCKLNERKNNKYVINCEYFHNITITIFTHNWAWCAMNRNLTTKAPDYFNLYLLYNMVTVIESSTEHECIVYYLIVVWMFHCISKSTFQPNIAYSRFLFSRKV